MPCCRGNNNAVVGFSPELQAHFVGRALPGYEARVPCYAGLVLNFNAQLPQVEQTAKWEAARDEEARRLKRERRALDQQMRALVKLPTRKDRSEVRAALIEVATSIVELSLAVHASSHTCRRFG